MGGRRGRRARRGGSRLQTRRQLGGSSVSPVQEGRVVSPLLCHLHSVLLQTRETAPLRMTAVSAPRTVLTNGGFGPGRVPPRSERVEAAVNAPLPYSWRQTQTLHVGAGRSCRQS